MKISLNWLQDFIDLSEYVSKPEPLAEVLTKAGLEVEELSQPAKQFANVVVGHILDKGKHPNADKLSLCVVEIGNGIKQQIVCGAQNHKTGDKVVVALPGAVLPGDFAIKKSAIRGVESLGMLCSLKELGLAKESEGILILPAEAPVGKPIAEYLQMNDVIFELKVTPNRADCLSHYGLARELSCLLSKSLKSPAQKPKLDEAKSTQNKIKLSVLDADLCPRYSGRYIENVKIQESPDWLKKRLEAVGLKSINNIVDVTNYVMMELGQPMHAFDADQISGQYITVKKAAAGAKFTTLDGTELTLNGSELTINDDKSIVAIAGVIGGKNSGVSDQTKNIFLESAYFAPMAVRKASRAHGINTESGYRFSRGVDPNSTIAALDRATELLLKVAGGVAYSKHHDNYPNPYKKSRVQTSLQTVSDRIGYPAQKERFEDYLKRLGCEVKVTGNDFDILPPTFRFDLELEMDFVEEYARLNGYDLIPETLPVFENAPSAQDINYVLTQKVQQRIKQNGYRQALNMVFSDDQKEKDFLGALANPAVALLNPLNSEMGVLRRSLAFGLFKNLIGNYYQGNDIGRLFETGVTFNKEAPESVHLGMLAWGQQKDLWSESKNVVFEIKSVIESLFLEFNIKSYTFKQNPDEKIPAYLHPFQSAVIVVEGKTIGYFGGLHPSLADENKIRTQVAVAELDLSLLFKGQPRSYRVSGISKMPGMQRDLALVMDKKLQAGVVKDEIKKAAGSLLTGIDIFDIYEGDKLLAGLKSIAFRLNYQDEKATLQDEVVNASINNVLAVLKQKYSVTVR